ncbi:MAG: cyclic nucleotide-binding domain-containing protein [Proteobacteria bacterium]|nr:cyclic nucleotide-binding domain-containing protein [Pseudomonadota bacterium]
MARTLKDLKDEADRRLTDGKTLEALKIYRLILEGIPLDFEMRLEIGDVIAKLGKTDLASAIYRAVADHDIKSGSPLRAIAALKRTEAQGIDVSRSISLLADTYAADSAVTGRGVKPAPSDYSAEVRKDLSLEYAIAPEKLILETAQMAAYTKNIENYPDVVPPLPIFSTLSRVAFIELLRVLRLKRFAPGDGIIRQGNTGDAVYFLARGEVRVTRAFSDSDGVEHEIQLARLGPGSLFGEMALVSTDPRSASVICETYVDALELTSSLVWEISEKIPQVGEAMTRFTRERMVTNLLATNPLFKPFDEDSKKDLLARFTGHEVPEGTIFLEQGNPGNGLYVVLQGKAEVLKCKDDEHIKIADLGPGDMAGEISLLYDEPISATVRTTTPATLLFLARELFMPIVDAIPELLAHFNRLAEERLADTDSKLMQKKLIDDDFIEEVDEEVTIDDDDLVFL